jgi:hypothetical protein
LGKNWGHRDPAVVKLKVLSAQRSRAVQAEQTADLALLVTTLRRRRFQSDEIGKSASRSSGD